MRVTPRLSAVVISVLVLFSVSEVGEAGTVYSFTTIDGPSPGEGGEFTFVQGISDTHLVVGYAKPNSPCTNSFLYDNGAFVPIAVPEFPGCTEAHGVNNRGEVVGNYGFAGILPHAFFLSEGTYTTIDGPSGFFTQARGISDTGLVTGSYGPRGFVYDHGAFTFFDVPGALQTSPQGINNTSHVVGYYRDATGSHGFSDSNGDIRRIDVPGARHTFAIGMNDRGKIAGTFTHIDDPFAYPGGGGGLRGFIYDGGRFTFLDLPGAVSTQATGINNRGQVVGSFLQLQWHGFLANPILSMDVAPESEHDKLDLRKSTVIVAIRSTWNFSALEVDTASLTFGRTGTEQSLAACRSQSRDAHRYDSADAYHDASEDLVCTFHTDVAGFQCGDEVAVLQGRSLVGTTIQGTDSIDVVPCH